MFNRFNSHFLRWAMVGAAPTGIAIWIVFTYLGGHDHMLDILTLGEVIVFAASWMMHISHTMAVADDAMEDDE